MVYYWFTRAYLKSDNSWGPERFFCTVSINPQESNDNVKAQHTFHCLTVLSNKILNRTAGSKSAGDKENDGSILDRSLLHLMRNITISLNESLIVSGFT